MDVQLDKLDELDGASLRAQALEDAQAIARQTPLEPPDASWDDPEDWQENAVRLAHAIRILGSRGSFGPSVSFPSSAESDTGVEDFVRMSPLSSSVKP